MTTDNTQVIKELEAENERLRAELDQLKQERGEPFAWCLTDVNGEAFELVYGPAITNNPDDPRKVTELYKASSAPAAVPELDGPYGKFLRPFLTAMETELYANSGKGDRKGWLSMTKPQAILEIYYHAAKLQKAVQDDAPELIVEHTADVANMSMMLLDICGYLCATPQPGEPSDED